MAGELSQIVTHINVQRPRPASLRTSHTVEQPFDLLPPHKAISEIILNPNIVLVVGAHVFPEVGVAVAVLLEVVFAGDERGECGADFGEEEVV